MTNMNTGFKIILGVFMVMSRSESHGLICLITGVGCYGMKEDVKNEKNANII